MTVAGPRRLNNLLEAVVAIGQSLDLPATLRRITELAVELVDARYGALGVLDVTGDRLSEFITVGVDQETQHAIGDLPEGHGILGLLIVDAKPLRLPDLHEHPDAYGFPPNHPEMHSFLGVPIRVRDQVFGNLYLTEKISDEVFSDVDEELLIGLAAAAGVAIENARLHDQVRRIAISKDRERIARDLHDTVIQRLFATGLSLQGTLSVVARDPDMTVERIESAIDDLDDTVKTIRTTIFSFEATRRSRAGIRDRLLGLCHRASEALGFEPRVTFDGTIETTIADEIAEDLAATLQEALSNVAKHAVASEARVSLIAEADTLTLTVADDGVGLPKITLSSGHGLGNMRDRAEKHGGTLELSPRPDGGTMLCWTVPLTVSGENTGGVG